MTRKILLLTLILSSCTSLQSMWLGNPDEPIRDDVGVIITDTNNNQIQPHETYIVECVNTSEMDISRSCLDVKGSNLVLILNTFNQNTIATIKKKPKDSVSMQDMIEKIFNFNSDKK